MPTRSYVDPRDVLISHQDYFGHDRLARSFLKTLPRLKAGTTVMVHGAPGSGKNTFLLRCAALMAHQRDTLDFDPTARVGTWCWYNPWLYLKHGNILSGLVATMSKYSESPQALERARDIVGHLNRMHFGDSMPTTSGTGVNRGDVNPVERVRRGFVQLTEMLRQQNPGRVVVFIEDCDMLRPSARLLLLEGLRLLSTENSSVTFVVAIGRQSALEAMRVREGAVDDISAAHCLAELVDLDITVPGLDVRRISQLVQKHLGTGAQQVRQAFGSDATDALGAALTARPLGRPRFLERLSGRVLLLAEYALDARTTRELSEAQWAWVIVSERWPEFRRFMLRGGRDRWLHLRDALSRSMGQPQTESNPEVVAWLQKDLILTDYLRLYADDFEREAESVYWLETLQLACGL
ncbi:MAG: P-loop NTPase fold protein [Myxococcota bacterium]|nr:P-loop NTPase fold protein [Myxococcota bacterium]